MRQDRIQRRARISGRSFTEMGVSSEDIDAHPFNRMARMPFPHDNRSPENAWTSSSWMTAWAGRSDALQSRHCSIRPISLQDSL